MGRKKQAIKRNCQFNVGLTPDEHALLMRQAFAAGMRPVDYGRARLFSKHFQTSRRASETPRLDPLLLTHLSRIGNNLNQIARQINARPIPAPPGLEILVQELRVILRRAVGP